MELEVSAVGFICSAFSPVSNLAALSCVLLRGHPSKVAAFVFYGNGAHGAQVILRFGISLVKVFFLVKSVVTSVYSCRW